VSGDLDSFGRPRGTPFGTAPTCVVCRSTLEGTDIEETDVKLKDPRSPWGSIMYARTLHRVYKCPKCKKTRAVGPAVVR
jgi:hypothetical protein